MDFIDALISNYCENHTTRENLLLQKINRETHAEVLMPRMLSGHLQGRFLSMLTAIKKPKVILEIGTYTGYSALCMAEHLPADGLLITVDINEELETRVQGYFEQSGKNHQIKYIIGNATEIIPTLSYSYDMVFIDADKQNYSYYYDLIIDKLNVGGIIIADNVLWSGKVTHPELHTKDKDLAAILAFNQKIHNDPRVENLLLPVRDGLMTILKITQ